MTVLPSTLLGGVRHPSPSPYLLLDSFTFFSSGPLLFGQARTFLLTFLRGFLSSQNGRTKFLHFRSAATKGSRCARSAFESLCAYLRNADHFSVRVLDGHAEQGLGLVPCHHVDLVVEPLILRKVKQGNLLNKKIYL